MHDVIYVAPQVVVFRNVPFEATFRVPVECESIEVADKAYVHHVVFNELLLFSELGKRIDDDTEQDVEQNDLYQNQESHVMGQLNKVLIWCVSVINWL